MVLFSPFLWNHLGCLVKGLYSASINQSIHIWKPEGRKILILIMGSLDFSSNLKWHRLAYFRMLVRKRISKHHPPKGVTNFKIILNAPYWMESLSLHVVHRIHSIISQLYYCSPRIRFDCWVDLLDRPFFKPR